MRNPLSAKTSSLGSKSSKKPDSLVICLSETHPPHPGDINEIAPAGVMPIKYLMVLYAPAVFKVLLECFWHIFKYCALTWPFNEWLKDQGHTRDPAPQNI